MFGVDGVAGCSVWSWEIHVVGSSWRDGDCSDPVVYDGGWGGVVLVGVDVVVGFKGRGIGMHVVVMGKVEVGGSGWCHMEAVLVEMGGVMLVGVRRRRWRWGCWWVLDVEGDL